MTSRYRGKPQAGSSYSMESDSWLGRWCHKLLSFKRYEFLTCTHLRCLSPLLLTAYTTSSLLSHDLQPARNLMSQPALNYFLIPFHATAGPVRNQRLSILDMHPFHEEWAGMVEIL